MKFFRTVAIIITPIGLNLSVIINNAYVSTISFILFFILLSVELNRLVRSGFAKGRAFALVYVSLGIFWSVFVMQYGYFMVRDELGTGNPQQVPGMTESSDSE